MNYIDAETFLKQPKEIQRVLLDWWKPSIGDITTGRTKSIVVVQTHRDITALAVYKGQPYSIPLFTEGQLRKFIEEKYLLEMDNFKTVKKETFYSVGIYKNLNQTTPRYISMKPDLLEAYWKVACEIAQEVI